MKSMNDIYPILVAEDDDDDFLLMEEAFRNIGFHNPVQRVVNGEELLAYLLAQGKYGDKDLYPWPFLLILDINMPVKNGFEALKMIRQNEKLSTLPVIILSTSGNEDSVKNGYRLGANSYIVKPSKFDDLLVICKRVKEYWTEIVTVFDERLPMPHLG